MIDVINLHLLRECRNRLKDHTPNTSHHSTPYKHFFGKPHQKEPAAGASGMRRSVVVRSVSKPYYFTVIQALKKANADTNWQECYKWRSRWRASRRLESNSWNCELYYKPWMNGGHPLEPELVRVTTGKGSSKYYMPRGNQFAEDRWWKWIFLSGCNACTSSKMLERTELINYPENQMRA